MPLQLRAAPSGAPNVRALAKEETLIQALGDVTDFSGVVRSGLLHRPSLRRLWRCVKKQTARGESTNINVASRLAFKPAQTDLLFHIAVPAGILSTGIVMHRQGHISAAALAAMPPADRGIAQRWACCKEPDGGAPAPTTVAFQGLMVARHVTNVRLDKATQYCDACLRAAPRLLTCARCQVATFCSEECQRAAWPAHRAWCRAAAALPDTGQDSHAIVPTGKCEVNYALVQMDRGSHRRCQRRQMQDMQRHVQMLEIRGRMDRGELPPMTPAQMERLRRFLVVTGGVPPKDEKELRAVLGA